MGEGGGLGGQRGRKAKLPWGFLSLRESLCASLQNETGSIVMVNFYNEYVSCSAKATLQQVAGESRGAGDRVGGEGSRDTPKAAAPHCPLPFSQITWTT